MILNLMILLIHQYLHRVLGDNRNNSEDSRFASFGMVKRSNIVGKVWMVIEPFSSFGFVK